MSFLFIQPVSYYFSKDKKLYQAIKNIFGFYPRNIFLYRLAFLHKSAGEETLHGIRINNERLEFLGDAILDAITADYLFKTFPTKDEGFLTEMRSKLVSRVQLNKLSQKLGLEKLVRLDSSSTNIYRSFQGDAFEALIGAIYLDRGYRFTRHIILDRIIRHYFDINELVNQEVNFKSRMIEWSQKEKKQLNFQVTEEVGTGYRKQYIIDILVDNQPIARGQDYSIKGAEQNAAEKAWSKLSEQNNSRTEG
ncbi:MAG: ribonuclease III [Bacteroidetes bacterium]|nr:ribonuclease III [Bacteroidota bacterium]